jgi:arabinogalactan oligomer / maltooligosaccharide transport system permease protein
MPYIEYKPKDSLTYIEYMSLSSKDKAKLQIKSKAAGLGIGFVNFFISIGMFFANIGKKIGRSASEVGYAFKHGDIWTRLSFLFLGTSHIARGQVLKGICLFLIEVLFILYMFFVGGTALQGLATLGSTKIHYFCSYDGTVPAGGDYANYVFTDQGAAQTFCNFFGSSNEQGNATSVAAIYGDNSSLLMLFGILAVIILVAFVFYYVGIVKASITVQEKKESRQYLNSAFDDLRELLDKKFYLTLLFLPIVGILVFTVLPLIDMIMMAFTNYNTTHQYPSNLFTWVGFTNFANLFSGGSSGSNFSYTFFHVLGWTLIWAFFATFLNYFLGVLVAMLINKKGIKLKKLWRTVLVISIAVPQFVSLMTWNKFISSSGLLQAILQAFGWIKLGDKLTILDYTWSARLAVILINIWIGIPYTMLVTTGILMNIPADLYESAQIDGATPTRVYFKITLPYILFVTGPYLITQFVGNINNFNVIYFLTGGAPVYSDYMGAGHTDLLVTWLYKLTVNESNYAYASVIGIMIFIISAVFSLIAYKNSSAIKNEEDFA